MAEREPLSSADAFWLRMDHPTNLMMITGILGFDEPLDFDVLRKLVEHRMLAFRRFRQCVADAGGTPRWEDDPYFDIDAHVHRVALPRPGDKAALQDLTSDLMSTPLDPTKPMWQLHLVENYGDGCAIVARLHHCYADGMALVRVLLSLTDPTPEASLDLPLLPERVSQAKRSLLGRVFRPVGKAVGSTVRTAVGVVDGAAGLVADPGKLLDGAKQGLSLGAALSRILLLPGDADTSLKGPLVVRKRGAWTRPLPLAEVKAAAGVFDGKVNDLVMAVAAGALRRYLLERGEEVEDDVRVVVPVNLRPLDEAPQLGNRFGLVFLTLPVATEGIRARVDEVKRRMDQIKGSSEAIVTFGVLQAAGVSPDLVQRQLVELFAQKASAIATNVPGPQKTVYFAGKPLREIMFWVPQSGGLSLGISILSYAGEVVVGIAADTRRLPDPQALVDAFHDEFDAVRAALGAA